MQQERLLIHVMHPDALVAAGIVALLGNHAEFDIAQGAGDMPDSAGTGVVITDHAGGIDMARACAAAGAAGPRILIVTHHDKEAHVRQALDLGVHGYLLQECSADELCEAVRQLGKGLRYLTGKVSRSIADSITRALLTRRESDVLNLLATGHCNKLIARELGIGVGTVKTHIKGLLTKLDEGAHPRGRDRGPARARRPGPVRRPGDENHLRRTPTCGMQRRFPLPLPLRHSPVRISPAWRR